MKYLRDSTLRSKSHHRIAARSKNGLDAAYLTNAAIKVSEACSLMSETHDFFLPSEFSNLVVRLHEEGMNANKFIRISNSHLSLSFSMQKLPTTKADFKEVISEINKFVKINLALNINRSYITPHREKIVPQISGINVEIADILSGIREGQKQKPGIKKKEHNHTDRIKAIKQENINKGKGEERS
jgi:hypothetical protein